MITAKLLVPSIQMPASTTVFYTVPDKTRAVIKKFTLTNTTAGALTATIYLNARGDPASDANTLAKTITIPAAGARPVDLTEAIDHILNQGDVIRGVASAATSITIRVSGIEIS